MTCAKLFYAKKHIHNSNRDDWKKILPESIFADKVSYLFLIGNFCAVGTGSKLGSFEFSPDNLQVIYIISQHS